MSDNVCELYCSSQPEVVIAVDFGTTCSGFAYANVSDTPRPEILDNCKWPGDSKAGAKPYCKNQTSLFYIPVPGKPGHFELQDWGWSAFHAFSKATAQSIKVNGASSNNSLQIAASSSSSLSALAEFFARKFKHYVLAPADQDRTQFTKVTAASNNSLNAASSSSSSFTQFRSDALNLGGDMVNKVGYFAHKFKLYLAPEERKEHPMPSLPGDLTAERLVVDYLRKLSDFIMEELKVAIRKGFSMKEVQWCLTVPAIWDEDAKQAMRNCAERAGMVKGPKCPRGVEASPRALDIILEPEAASVYCQNKAKSLKLGEGDKILVADVGGGTIDLVVHEVVERHPSEGVTKVREVVAGYGDTGGGTFVDAGFFELICQKIGCFKEFCRDMNPSMSILIYSWWQGIKTDFDGPGYTAELSLMNSALGQAWQKHDKQNGINQGDDYYQELCLDDTEILSIFDPEVNKVLQLIEKQIEKVRVLMVVGRFAGSLYLRKRVWSMFAERVEEIIIPENPGSAICRGAVQLHMQKGYIKSRISKKTYGLSIRRKVKFGDPPELIRPTDDGERRCTDVFEVFVRAGTCVEMNASVKNSYSPPCHGQKTISFSLYSSPKAYPKYTTEADAKEEGRFEVDISEGMKLDKAREVEVTMHFGDSLITVSAVRRNFGTRSQEQALSVTFQHTQIVSNLH